jgi:hypothetical protein
VAIIMANGHQVNDSNPYPCKIIGAVAISGVVSVQDKGSGAIVGADLVPVPVAGTAVQLPNIPCREIQITAKRGNTGYILVGGATVSATSYGKELAALATLTLKVSNANEIYINATVATEAASYIAIL